MKVVAAIKKVHLLPSLGYCPTKANAIKQQLLNEERIDSDVSYSDGEAQEEDFGSYASPWLPKAKSKNSKTRARETHNAVSLAILGCSDGATFSHY